MTGPDLPPRALAIGAHYLLDLASRRLERGERPAPLFEEVFGAARGLGAPVVRAMASLVLPDAHDERALPGTGGRLGAIGLRALEEMLASARRHDVRLVLSLGNSWDDYGGARGLVALAGLETPRACDARAFVHPEVRRLRRAFVSRLLDHRSTLDGHALGAHPAVLAWEPMNEPRTPGLDRGGRAMRAWLDAEAATIRAHAPGVAISSGEDGVDVAPIARDARFWAGARATHLFRHTTSFARNVEAPDVTWPSVHVYPEAWGVPPLLRTTAAERFVRESAALAARAGKRLLVGEVGATGGERWAVIGAATRAGWAAGALVGLWMLAAEGAPRHRDAYAFTEAEARLALAEIRRGAP